MVFNRTNNKAKFGKEFFKKYLYAVVNVIMLLSMFVTNFSVLGANVALALRNGSLQTETLELFDSESGFYQPFHYVDGENTLDFMDVEMVLLNQSPAGSDADYTLQIKMSSKTGHIDTGSISGLDEFGRLGSGSLQLAIPEEIAVDYENIEVTGGGTFSDQTSIQWEALPADLSTGWVIFDEFLDLLFGIIPGRDLAVTTLRLLCSIQCTLNDGPILPTSNTPFDDPNEYDIVNVPWDVTPPIYYGVPEIIISVPVSSDIGFSNIHTLFWLKPIALNLHEKVNISDPSNNVNFTFYLDLVATDLGGLWAGPVEQVPINTINESATLFNIGCSAPIGLSTQVIGDGSEFLINDYTDDFLCLRSSDAGIDIKVEAIPLDWATASSAIRVRFSPWTNIGNNSTRLKSGIVTVAIPEELRVDLNGSQVYLEDQTQGRYPIFIGEDQCLLVESAEDAAWEVTKEILVELGTDSIPVFGTLFNLGEKLVKYYADGEPVPSDTSNGSLIDIDAKNDYDSVYIMWDDEVNDMQLVEMIVPLQNPISETIQAISDSNIAIRMQSNFEYLMQDENDNFVPQSDSIDFVIDSLSIPDSQGTVDFQLLHPIIAPGTNGNPQTNFQFEIEYLHSQGLAPSEVEIVVDAVEYPMTSQDSDFASGANYSIALSGFDIGSHFYYFQATQGNETIRLPETGNLSFSIQWSNVPPQINLFAPNNDEAFKDFIIQWSDDDPDSNAIIQLGYDTDGASCDGAEIQNYISEDWTTDSWVWRDIPQGGPYWVYAIIDDGINDPVCEYSPGTLSIEDASNGNGFDIDHIEIRDEDEGDGDGIWEAGEQTDLKVYITNISNTEFSDVYGIISTQNGFVNIIDAEDDIWDSMPGVTRDGTFEVSASSNLIGTVNFDIDIYYREVGGSLQVDSESFEVVVSPVGATPYFVISDISFDDSDLTEADGDNIPESGEDDVYVDIELTNSGGATATNVEGIITSQPPEILGLWLHDDADYPDIAPGSSVSTVGGPFRIDDIPANFSGNTTQTMTVYYGVNKEFSQEIPFTITISPTPRIKVLDQAYNFGLVSPGTLVTHDFQVQNIGTQTATVTSVNTSHGDLTFPNHPTSIAPGATETFSAVFDTTGINASVVRTFEIISNAHSLSKSTGEVSGTITDVQTASLDLIESMDLSINAENVGAGDTDGDGLMEIIITDEIIVDPGVNYTRVYLYEQTAIGSSTFVEIWNSSNNISSIAHELGTMAVGDINGDNKDDIAIATSNPSTGPYKVIFLTTSGNNNLAIHTIATESVNKFYGIAIGDSDNDGSKEIIVGVYGRNTVSGNTDLAEIRVLEYTSGTSFAQRWNSPPIYDFRDEARDEDDKDGAKICGIGINDTDKDGSREIVIGTDRGQVQIYENTGNNSYANTPREDINFGSSIGGGSDWCDLIISDVDNDTKPEIIYTNDDDNQVWLYETTANDSWTQVWNQVVPAGDSYQLAGSDIDQDGVGEFIVTYRQPDGFSVYESFGDNSYASIFDINATTDPDMVPDTPVGISVVDLVNDAAPELLFGVDNYGYVIVGNVTPLDLVINDWNIQFTPTSAVEDEQVTIEATITNASDIAISNVEVEFYNGDPQTGGSLIDSVTINSIGASSSALASITTTIDTAGNSDIYVIVDPTDAVSETDENNNSASSTLTVSDDDTEAPVVTGLSVAEHNGDGDGIIEDDEQVKISWTATDASGISSSSITVACSAGAVTNPSGDQYEVIVGACAVDDYPFDIDAIDNDNSTEQTSISDAFSVVPHEPIIDSVFPTNSATGVPISTLVQAAFGWDMDPSSLTSITFTLETSGGQPVFGNVSFDDNARKVTFSPSVPLMTETTYVATLISGAQGVLDENENTLPSDYTWQFTTALNQPPNQPNQPDPADSATGVPIDQILQWSATDPENDALTFDVYFGTSNPPTTLLCQDSSPFACNPGSLQFDTTYYWQVIAKDAGGSHNGPVWDFTTTPDIQAPSGLVATTVSNSQIDLTWTDNSSDETSFRIERSTDGANWIEIDSVSADVTAYSDQNLNCETQYYYRVRAYRVSDDAYSPYSNTDSDTTGLCGPLVSPSGTIDFPDPSFTWVEDPTATWYHLEILKANDELIHKDWYAVTAGMCSSNLCSLDPSLTLLNDDYKWSVQPWSPANPDEIWPAHLDFTVAVPLPDLLAPADASTIIDDSTPEFQWEETFGATWYQLNIDGTGGNVLKKWYAVAGDVSCVAGTCSVTPGDVLPNDDYTWEVLPYTAAGNGLWYAGFGFTLNVPPPPMPDLLLPTDASTIVISNPTYEWEEAPGATWYHMVVDDTAGNVIDTWFAVGGDVSCVAGTCSITPPVQLDNDDYTWSVRPWSAVDGFGPWYTNFTFTVAVPLPDLLAPADASTIIDDSTPEFQWEETFGATWYQLNIDGTGGNVLKKWYAVAGDVSCVAGTCSVTPGDVLPNDDYTWEVLPYTAAGNGLWYAGFGFTLNVPPPPMPDLLLPTDASTIVISNPTYEWEEAPGATWYHMVVDDTAGNVIDTWFAVGGDVSCVAGTCSITPPVQLDNDDYTWSVRPYSSSGGNGLWYPSFSFTINLPVPLLLSPADSSTMSDTTPEFQWDETAGTEWYLLNVDGTSGNVINEWFEVGVGVTCTAGTCSAISAMVFPYDDYTWSVQPYSAGEGYSSFYASFNFTVALVVPPANDDIDNATTISSMPFNDTLEITAATTVVDDPNLTCASGQATPQKAQSVWYMYTPAVDGELSISTAGSNYQTVSEVWSGTRGSLIGVGCNIVDSYLVTLTGGITYYIEVAAWDAPGNPRTLNLSLEFTPDSPQPPGNDDFDNAIVIGSMPYTHTLEVTEASTAGDDPVLACASDPKVQSVWYEYTPSVDGVLNINTNGSNYETVANVWSGTRGSLTSHGCNYVNPFNVNLTGGETYYIELASWDAPGNPRTLELALDFTPN